MGKFSWKRERPSKTCAVIRYGAWGDVLQSSSILPGLKRQGYHITFFCTPRGIDAIEYDPHIDRFVLQDEDMVPNHLLGEYIEYLKTKYTKVINLCETVEGIVLPISARAHFHWSKEARHAICNKNYVELQHQIAEVPYTKPENFFYSTKEEHDWAIKEKGSNTVILWAIAGSGVHKVWPHIDDCINAVLTAHPTVKIFFVGAKEEKKLQGEWEHPRVFKKAGEWTIRQAMAMAQISDVVVGPETGILNSVCVCPNAKVLLLSHSTVENLSRDWVNTISLWSDDAPCYPCHQLHFDGWKYCNRHPEGTAVCQYLLKPDRVYDAIMRSLKHQERLAA